MPPLACRQHPLVNDFCFPYRPDFHLFYAFLRALFSSSQLFPTKGVAWRGELMADHVCDASWYHLFLERSLFKMLRVF